MPLSSKQRKELFGRSHALSPMANVGDEPPSDTVVEHVRSCLESHPLGKIRVNADDGATCDAIGRELASRVPCEVVKRVGRVLIVYRPPAD